MDRTEVSRRREAAVRRRRVAAGTLIASAAAAFVLGASLGQSGDSNAASPASQLALPQLAGERVIASLHGTGVSPRLRKAVRKGRIAGVVLFAESFPSRAAARGLTRELLSIPRPPGLRDPLLVMVDQEGGQVTRVGGAPTASAAEMGARGAEFSRRQGAATARNLSDLGVNVDLAPVLDLGVAGGVIAGTERAFGATPARVEASAIPFAEALQAGGVAATGKHFPGFGRASENTDFAGETIAISKDRLRRLDEAPFRAFVAAGGDLVMLSTAVYPAFGKRPAAFNSALAGGELRDRLGFEGVSVTDALGSVAATEFGGPAAAGVAAARAGTDLLLYNDLATAEKGWKALARKLRTGKLKRAPFEESVERVLELRASLAPGRGGR